MPRNDHGPTRPSIHTRGLVLAILIGGLVVGVAILGVVRRPGQAALELPPPSRSPRVTATTTTIGEKQEVVIRLREILRVRDRAYRERDIKLLNGVYTTDCPCLRGDRDAIRQLLQDDAVWVGASTSVRVQKLEKVNDRLWIVVADFIGSPFRIETESGGLIRAVEGKTELFRFALTRTNTRTICCWALQPLSTRSTDEAKYSGDKDIPRPDGSCWCRPLAPFGQCCTGMRGASDFREHFWFTGYGPAVGSASRPM
jgi:hypothetical protein